MLFTVLNSNLRLAGTLHAFPKEFPAVPDWLWQAYAWAEDVVVESNFSTFAPHRLLQRGDRLSNYLPADVFQQVSALWNVSEGPLDQMKPWAVFLALPSMTMAMVPGVEAHIRARARKDNKPLWWLENGSDVTPHFDAIPPQRFTESISSMVKDLVTVHHKIRHLHRAWLLGDYATAAVDLPIFSDPLFHEAFVARRNRTWMPSIRLGATLPRRVLVLVGALHLCGPQSLPELIGEDGYDLCRLM